MIRSKDLNQEIKVLEGKVKDGGVTNSDVLKGICLLIKVGRDIRTNQVTALVKQYGKDILIKAKMVDKEEAK